MWKSKTAGGGGNKYGWEQVSKLDFFVDREKGLFLSVYVDDIKLAGKKQNMNPTWKIQMKDVDLGEPTSFLDHVYLGCTQRECQISKDIVDNYRSMFESGISAGATEKLPQTSATEKPDAETISSWSYDIEGHAKKCVDRYCEFANKTTEQQAADAISAHTQVKMEDAHKLLKIPKSDCPDIWIRLPRHKWPKSWSSMEDPVVPLERNLYGHPLAGLFWERQFEKILLKYGWEKVSNLGILIRTP